MYVLSRFLGMKTFLAVFEPNLLFFLWDLLGILFLKPNFERMWSAGICFNCTIRMYIMCTFFFDDIALNIFCSCWDDKYKYCYRLSYF